MAFSGKDSAESFSNPYVESAQMPKQLTICSVTQTDPLAISVAKQLYILGRTGSHNLQSASTAHSFECDQIYDNQEVDAVSQSRKDPTADHCVVCYSAEKDTVCIPCRHLCICFKCAEIIKHLPADSNQRNRCPMCRTMAAEFIHLKTAPGNAE